MQCRGRLLGRMERPREDPSEDTGEETYNPWSVVNLVFRHLADEGLHPVLGESGDPGKPAAELLKCLGIMPAAEGNRHVASRVHDELARLRQAFEADNPR
jgi:hypothetical protein